MVDLIVDDFLRGESEGWTVRDHSRPPGSPGEWFNVRTVLLFWSGDYPALGKACGFSHAGGRFCHWCAVNRFHDPVLNRVRLPSVRRFLPESHHLRSSALYDREEHGPAPEDGTHASVVRSARQHRACLTKAAHDRLTSDTGIREETSLSMLYKWDLVWDMTLDGMHLVAGFFPLER